MTEWRRLHGDGTDPLPQGWYDVRLRNGVIWTNLIVTTWCRSFGKNLFRHRGSPTDPMEIREHDPGG